METAQSTADVAADPLTEAYKPGIDRTILRHNLQLTIEQRIEQLQALMRSIEEMQETGRRARAGGNTDGD